MPPVVPPRLHGAVGVDALHHQHVLHARRPAIDAQGLIHGRLQGHRLVFTEATIGGDHRLGLAIDQTITQRISREAAEHHRVGSTDAGTGQHGDRRLRHHRHVERHEVALADAQRFERVGRLAHLGMQLAIGEGAGIAGFAFPNEGRFVGTGASEMAIKAVGAEVGGAAFKPAGKGRIAPIEHRVKRLKPMKLTAGGVAPEGIRISCRLLSQISIGLQ